MFGTVVHRLSDEERITLDGGPGFPTSRLPLWWLGEVRCFGGCGQKVAMWQPIAPEFVAEEHDMALLHMMHQRERLGTCADCCAAGRGSQSIWLREA